MRKKNGITKRAWACSIAILLTIALLFGGCGASSGASAQKDGALYAGTADTEEAMASDAASMRPARTASTNIVVAEMHAMPDDSPSRPSMRLKMLT